MQIKIGCGKTEMPLFVPDVNLMGILTANDIPAGTRGRQAVREALLHPIGRKRLKDIVYPGEKIAVITSDITRPFPSSEVLPIMLDELWTAGVAREDVTIVFALGIHRGHTREEMEALVGKETYGQIKCVDSDPGDVIRMGITSRGTPVDITRVVAGADRRIALGNIEYHYFAGYSGGGKAIMPGVSTREAISKNHGRMTEPGAAAGRLEDNPIRMDIEEAAELCGLDFIVNVVLGEDKEILYAVAGHHIKAHREGCRFLDRIYLKQIDCKADIVIASQGGFPKDINLYQTQKALDNAKHAVRDGGIIILTGACNEGFGEKLFEEWMLEAGSPQELTERIEKDFRLGGHKAAAIALVLRQAEIYLVSEMPGEIVKKCFMQPFCNIDEALDSAFCKLGRDAKVLVMPHAGSTLPIVR